MNENRELAKIKAVLRKRVTEWLGSDIPNEGTEDFDRWETMSEAVESIQSVEDLVEYLDGERIDFSEFVINGAYDLVSVGMDPQEIEPVIIKALGEEAECVNLFPTVSHRFANQCSQC